MIKSILFGALVANVMLLASSADTDSDYSPPPKNKCKMNERYVKCPSLLCQPQSCDQLGYPIACPIQGPDGECPGEPGCICIDGYLRNRKGVCVPQKQCPSCGGDPNAEPGCGQNCGKRCSDYKQSNVVCPLICKLNGCDCKKGYVYDDNIRKCVRPKDCRKCSGPNEYFSCGGACDNVCATLDKQSQDNCPIVNITCNNMCYCDKGYARDCNGICIPIANCPTKCD